MRTDPLAAPQRVRILCIDHAGAVLLLKWRDPVDGHIFWEPPGGGIEPGETSHQAAVRELHEETGLTPVLEERSVLVARDYHWKGQHHLHIEEFFFATVGAEHIGLEAPTDEELATFLDWHFVGPQDLEGLDAPLQPPDLAKILDRCRSRAQP